LKLNVDVYSIKPLNGQAGLMKPAMISIHEFDVNNIYIIFIYAVHGDIIYQHEIFKLE